MSDGIDYSAIDPGIRDLCRAINAHDEFSTLNSCQGHYAPEDVEDSTRSGPAGPYVIFKHPDPATDVVVDATLQDLEETVRDCDADAAYHSGALVKQLYPDAEEAQLYGRSAYTVTHPYRASNVPTVWMERFGDYGDAVELVLDEGRCSGLDRGTPMTQDVDDAAHYASVIDLQAFSDRRVEHAIENGEEGLVDVLEAERDHILDRIEEQVQAALA